MNLKNISICFLLILLPCANVSAEGYRRVEHSTIIKSTGDPQLNQLKNDVQEWYGFLVRKDYARLYDLIPQEYAKDLSKVDFLKALNDTTVKGVLDPVLPDVQKYDVEQILRLNILKAKVSVNATIRDVFRGLEDVKEESIWVYTNGRWISPDSYQRLFGLVKQRLSQRDAIDAQTKQEAESNIMEDEIYDSIVEEE